MLADLPRPAIIAHRGACAHAPENTLAAFELAILQDADAIELDAKLTADKHVVILHDASVDRTTDGTGRLSNLPLAAVQELDAGGYYSRQFQGQRVPTLEEVFETVGRSCPINIELTNYTTPLDGLPQVTADLVRRFGLTDQVLFSSFNPLALSRVKRALPAAATALLALSGIGGTWARWWSGSLVPHQALHAHLRDVDQALVSRCHRQGQRLHIYTVNAPQEMSRLFDLGVDGIFTDDPSLARQVLMKGIPATEGRAG